MNRQDPYTLERIGPLEIRNHFVRSEMDDLSHWGAWETLQKKTFSFVVSRPWEASRLVSALVQLLEDVLEGDSVAVEELLRNEYRQIP